MPSAGFEFENCRTHDLRHAACVAAADGIVLRNVVPGIRGLVAIRQPDLARRAIVLLDAHFDLLAESEDLAGVVDAIPRHLADVNQPIDAPQIDKRAEILQAANDSFVCLADGQFLELLAARFLAFAFEQRAAAEHQVPPIGIGFRHHRREALPY